MTRIIHRGRFSTPRLVQDNMSKPEGISPLFAHSANTAFAYNQAGQDYALYADGDSAELFGFTGIHAYADRCLWARLNAALLDLRETGASSINILDAGCGPGTWLRRLTVRAHELGFTSINARGFDIAREQIRRARFLAKDTQSLPGVLLRFEVADFNSPLPEADASIDLTICLYSVLSHLPVARLEKIAAEIARVTRGAFITTVRPSGSLPTVFVDSVEKAASFQHDAQADHFDVTLNDGRRFTLNVHLFRAAELERLFSPYFRVTELTGLDLFHSRFSPDPRWNPDMAMADGLAETLSRLETSFAADPDFLEHATHLMLAGSRRRTN